MLQQNEGTLDRIIRVVAGLGLLLTGILVLAGVPGIVLGALGLILVVTGAIGVCPLYMPFNISTK